MSTALPVTHTPGAGRVPPRMRATAARKHARATPASASVRAADCASPSKASAARAARNAASCIAEVLEAETARHVAEAGLRYVTDAGRGFTRKRRGRSFAYYDAQGKLIADREVIARIKSLAIPPAYLDVWICPRPDGHIQATARDAKGRKQYRYHARWQAIRSEAKFERMAAFGEALPRIRRRVTKLLRQPGLPREKVLAALVQLLDLTLIRVGNDEYARLNRSYGLTTLLTRHVQVEGAHVRFEFKGKSGVAHRIALRHANLADFVRSCMEIPGRELFQWLDEKGKRHGVSAGDVNAFLQSLSGATFTAKDFRTWGASVLALGRLRVLAAGEAALTNGTNGAARRTVKATKRAIVETVTAVSEKLGNTPSVCRKSYIHPRVIESFVERPEILQSLSARAKRELRADEAALLALLHQAVKREDARATRGPKPRSAPVARVLRLRERDEASHARGWTSERRSEGHRIAA